MLLHNTTLTFFVTCWISSFSSAILASESSEQIQFAVNEFAQEYKNTVLLEATSGDRSDKRSNKRVEIKIGYVDPRLSLKPCTTPLEINLRRSNKTIGRLTTKVSCTSGSMWSLYVPMTIDLFQTVAVAGAPIPRGANLQSHHLQLKEKNISMLYNGYYIDQKALLGLVTTRSIKMGDVISPRNLTAPKVVYRNEEVTIIAKAGSLKVRARGIALSDGLLGEKISVRNKKTKKIIQARVKGPGKVEIQI